MAWAALPFACFLGPGARSGRRCSRFERSTAAPPPPKAPPEPEPRSSRQPHHLLCARLRSLCRSPGCVEYDLVHGQVDIMEELFRRVAHGDAGEGGRQGLSSITQPLKDPLRRAGKPLLPPTPPVSRAPGAGWVGRFRPVTGLFCRGVLLPWHEHALGPMLLVLSVQGPMSGGNSALLVISPRPLCRVPWTCVVQREPSPRLSRGPPSPAPACAI
jgi:hypothetical protein